MLNAQLGADFDLDAFDHVSAWNAEAEWIEHLEALLYDQAAKKNNALAAFGLLKRWAPRLYEERVRQDIVVKSLNANVTVSADDAKALAQNEQVRKTYLGET